MKTYDNSIKEIIYSEEVIKKRVEEIGNQITKDYAGEELVVVGVLRGSIIFVADLIRHIDLPVILDTVALASYYNGTESTGKVKINKDLESSITGKNVLIVEDIADRGVTLTFLTEMLQVRKAKSIKICTLLNKPSRRTIEVNLDYVGFDIEDHFVVGYGLDFAQKYRNYPHIGILKEEMYKENHE